MEVDVDIPAVDKPSEDADNFDMLEVFLSPTPMLELDIEEDDVKCLVVDGEADDATPGCDSLLDLPVKLSLSFCSSEFSGVSECNLCDL